MKEPVLLKIGRALNNDVVLNIPFISDYHLEIFQDPEGNVFMTDLNSENGTFVNGKRLNGFLMLQAKDEVFLGNGFKLQWEQVLNNPKGMSNETESTKVTVDREPKKYVDAYESIQTEKQKPIQKPIQKSNVSSSVKKTPKRENLDLIIIYGLILAFVLYAYFKVN